MSGKVFFQTFPRHGLNFNVVLISADFIRPDIIYTMKHCLLHIHTWEPPGPHFFFIFPHFASSVAQLEHFCLLGFWLWTSRYESLWWGYGWGRSPAPNATACHLSDVDCVVHDTKDPVSLLWRGTRCTLSVCVCLLCCRLPKERVKAAAQTDTKGDNGGSKNHSSFSEEGCLQRMTSLIGL